MVRRLHKWEVGCMYVLLYGWMDVWNDRWMDGWMVRYMMRLKISMEGILTYHFTRIQVWMELDHSPIDAWMSILDGWICIAICI